MKNESKNFIANKGDTILSISDLHLGHPASKGKKVLTDIATQIISAKFNGAKALVINGDGIEGKDIPFKNEERAKEEIDNNIYLIKTVMRMLMDYDPDFKLIYILGNHDSYNYIHNQLTKLTETFPNNFIYSTNYVQVGNSLYTHLDLTAKIDYENDQEHLVDAFSHGVKVESGTLNRHDNTATSFDSKFKNLSETEYRRGRMKSFRHFLVGTLAPKLISHKVFPIDKIALETIDTFKRNLGEPFKTVSHIFGGHTHHQGETEGVYNGIKFCITQPAITGNTCTMQLTTYGADGKVDSSMQIEVGKEIESGYSR